VIALDLWWEPVVEQAASLMTWKVKEKGERAGVDNPSERTPLVTHTAENPTASHLLEVPQHLLTVLPGSTHASHSIFKERAVPATAWCPLTKDWWVGFGSHSFWLLLPPFDPGTRLAKRDSLFSANFQKWV
jgi:hypothetical protein